MSRTRTAIAGFALFVAVCVSLAVVPLQGASATARAGAHRRSGSLFTLSATFHPSGSAYRWSLELERLRGHFALDIQAERDVPGLVSQLHSWRFRLPLGDAAIGPALHDARIRTGHALGPFGAIDLTFHSVRHARVRRDFCPASGALLFAYHDRAGTLSGSFHFTPNEGDLPVVQVAHMRAVSERDFATGAPCRADEPPPPVSCRGPKTMRLTDAAQHTRVFGFAGEPVLGFETFEHIGPAIVEHSMQAFARRRLVIKQKAGLVVDASTFTPLMSGVLKLKATGGFVGVGSGGSCQQNGLSYAWTSGTLTADFDSGAVSVTGHHVKATLRWRSR